VDWTGGQIKDDDSAEDIKKVDLTQAFTLEGYVMTNLAALKFINFRCIICLDQSAFVTKTMSRLNLEISWQVAPMLFGIYKLLSSQMGWIYPQNEGVIIASRLWSSAISALFLATSGDSREPSTARTEEVRLRHNAEI
jgi:hypothetical protein